MEKAYYEAILHGQKQSFLLRQFGKEAYDAPYHYHPELELTYITHGTGKRYVGNHMGYFSKGDLVLLGPNLPHCWKLIEQPEEETQPGAIVLQFDKCFLGDSFFEKSEMHPIQKLLNRSNSGICFKGSTATLVSKMLENMIAKDSSFDKLIGFLQILQTLAISNDYELLDSQTSTAFITAAQQERFYAVWAYIVENFKGNVSLQQAAGIANMTTNAFCKYFKKVTRKTFMETVLDFRLNYATQQLIQTDKSIAIVAFESGYGDISQFHKNFKSSMKVSPLKYRKQFLK
jgi:AraC-like DNA-binding protein